MSLAKLQAIQSAVYAKCDALDGLKDRIVGRPDLCNFDPAELKCTGAETDACLTDAQIETARLFVAPTTGRYPWAGFPFGAKGQQGTTAYVFGGPVVQFLLARLAQVWRSGLWTSATPWGARRRYDRGIARG